MGRHNFNQKPKGYNVVFELFINHLQSAPSGNAWCTMLFNYYELHIFYNENKLFLAHVVSKVLAMA